MSRSVLSSFFNDDLPTFIQQVNHKMTKASSDRLHKWGAAIHRPDADPAKELLQALIFADAPRILAEVTDSTNHIFRDIFIDFDPVCTKMESDDFAAFIDAINTTDVHDDDDDDDTNYYTTSTALTHLANYLRGDLNNATPLLYAITNRIWRNIYAYRYDSLFAATFILHTYLFHFLGWSPRHGDVPVGALYDRYSHLVGKDPVMTTHREWDDFAVTPHYGLPQFAVLPRVSHKMMANHAVYREQTVSLKFPFHTLVFADCGDDGVALMSQFEGHDVAYFLTWHNEDYDHAIHHFFTAHERADEMENAEDDWRDQEELDATKEKAFRRYEEEEADAKWDDFHSI
jgi:hypothetical protein